MVSAMMIPVCLIDARLRTKYAKRQAHIETLGETIPPTMSRVLGGIIQRFNAGIVPELTFEGICGTYYLKNVTQKPMVNFSL